MGSPYMMFQCSRVNVCRSATGFERVSQEILSITGSLEMRGLALVAGHQIREVLQGCESQLHYESYEAILAYRGGNQDALKEHYWDLLRRDKVWQPIAQAYVDICDTAVKAAIARRRLVCVIATSYTTGETGVLDRAIVFDFTKKETEVTQVLSQVALQPRRA